MFGGSIGTGELLLLVLILLAVFGADKLPEIGRALGRGLREFRKAMRNLEIEKGEEGEEEVRFDLSLDKNEKNDKIK